MLTKLNKPFLSTRPNNFPDFMIVGAQKAGTTALYEYLSQHPQIQPTKEKELHYFNCDARYKNGIEFYRSFFQPVVESKLAFDASPGYLHNPEAPGRIYAHNPDVKIIILLRDPVERAYSAWNMYRKMYLRNRNWFFDDWVSFCGASGFTILRRQDDHIFNFLQYAIDEIDLQDTNKPSTLLESPILSHGHYHDQIERYLSLFNESQILILENSQMRISTVECLQKIEAFLGVSGCDWRNTNLTPVFEGEYAEPVDVTARRLLNDYYAQSNERLFELLGERYTWGAE
jgi:Sulfotransferase domain